MDLIQFALIISALAAKGYISIGIAKKQEFLNSFKYYLHMLT